MQSPRGAQIASLYMMVNGWDFIVAVPARGADCITFDDIVGNNGARLQSPRGAQIASKKLRSQKNRDQVAVPARGADCICFLVVN